LIKKQKPPKAEKGGLSSLLTGKSHSQGGILIEAEGDEYITNKRRVAELGKGFFDFVNFAPLDKVKQVLSNFSIPSFTVPSMPKFAYSTGGYVQGGNYDTSGVENKLEQVIAGLHDLKQKEYNVQVKTHFKGVEFAREVNKAQLEYREYIK
jgi:hypothetical protein